MRAWLLGRALAAVERGEPGRPAKEKLVRMRATEPASNHRIIYCPQGAMSLTYAIPDLHGRLDLVEFAIAKIIEHSVGERATVVTLGDYVDYGPSSRQVIEFLMAWRSDKLSMVNLKGNHEAMMWQACNNPADLDWWLKNGGDQTLASYGQSFRDDPDPHVVPDVHLQWIADLALLHVDQHRVFVHAAVDPKSPLHRQNEQTLLWEKYPDGFDLGHGHRHVVHGHQGNPHAPIVTKGKTNLDGLAWKTGRLVVGVFDDDRPGGALEFLEIVGPRRGPSWRDKLSRLLQGFSVLINSKAKRVPGRPANT